MALRKTTIHAEIGEFRTVVHFDSDLSEYRVRLFAGSIPRAAADYFTDCPEDARATGWAMVRHAHSAAATPRDGIDGQGMGEGRTLIVQPANKR